MTDRDRQNRIAYEIYRGDDGHLGNEELVEKAATLFAQLFLQQCLATRNRARENKTNG